MSRTRPRAVPSTSRTFAPSSSDKATKDMANVQTQRQQVETGDENRKVPGRIRFSSSVSPGCTVCQAQKRDVAAFCHSDYAHAHRSTSSATVDARGKAAFTSRMVVAWTGGAPALTLWL